MTKEELEKEADNYANNLERELMKEYEDYPEYGQCSYLATIPVPHARSAYLAGAEPREKQIQIDAEQIRVLQKDKGNLTDKVKELEAQIEKMKSDVRVNIKVADQSNNWLMYQKLNSILNQWK